MKILVLNSSWRNVGNAWFCTSLYMLLKEMYPEYEIILGEDPIRISFRIKNNKEINNALNLIQYQDADIYIFAGPILSENFYRDYVPIIQQIKENKKDYAFISISGTGLTKLVSTQIGEFLQKYPPLFFSSRDEETYYTFKPYVNNIYNGICTAFLVNKTIPIYPIKMKKKFFISSFYRELEPIFILPSNKCCNIENLQIKHRKNILNLPYSIARHFNIYLKHQTEVGDHIIVRTIQDLNTKFNHINFACPNSFISYNPISYLNLTKSCEFVISDRVHACAIALACGKPARFLFNTKRAGIFDRMGFDYKKNGGIMYPNPEKIDSEKFLLENEIRKYI